MFYPICRFTQLNGNIKACLVLNEIIYLAD